MFLQTLLESVFVQYRFVAGHHIVAVVVDPDGGWIGSTVDSPLIIHSISHRRLVNNWVVGALGPVVEFVVGACGDADTGLRAQAPIGDGRNAVLIDEGASAKDARIDTTGLQRQRVMAPMHQVHAGNMRPAMPLLRLNDVHQVVASLPEKSAVGIERRTTPLGRHEMVSRTMRILQEDFSQLASAPNHPVHLVPSKSAIRMGLTIREESTKAACRSENHSARGPLDSSCEMESRCVQSFPRA